MNVIINVNEVICNLNSKVINTQCMILIMKIHLNCCCQNKIPDYYVTGTVLLCSHTALLCSRHVIMLASNCQQCIGNLLIHSTRVTLL
jgi:hypothetical protein